MDVLRPRSLYEKGYDPPCEIGTWSFPRCNLDRMRGEYWMGFLQLMTIMVRSIDK